MTWLEWLILGVISEAAYQRGREDADEDDHLALQTHQTIFAHMKEKTPQ